MTAQIIRGNALHLPLADGSVDLICTSPPYFGLRSYQDNGQHYEGQIGSEATPAEYVDALIAATREMVRVLKPAGSIWVNLGDKYVSRQSGYDQTDGGSWAKVHGETGDSRPNGQKTAQSRGEHTRSHYLTETTGIRAKSLIGIPARYMIRCVDDLGLILRAEVIWDKPNGLPESVRDRVRRSHEVWFHFVTQPRYYSAIDEIREEHSHAWGPIDRVRGRRNVTPDGAPDGGMVERPNPLGKLPGSVWTIPTQPLKVPAHLGVDHFAAFPMEWPRRIITAWSPREVCSVCGEGRRPVAVRDPIDPRFLASNKRGDGRGNVEARGVSQSSILRTGLQAGQSPSTHITGYACACPDTTAPTTPGIILDPFGGTGTTALVASVLGRHGITVDMSSDYCRLAEWRCNDPGERARAMQVDKPAVQVDGQAALFEVRG